MKPTLFSVLLFAALLFTTLASHAEMYRWVDAYGKVHIGVKPSEETVEMEEEDNDGVEAELSNETTDNAPPVVAEPVAPKAVVKHETPVAKPIVMPQAVAPVAKPASAPAPVVAAPAKAPAVVKKTELKKPKLVKKKAPLEKPAAKKAPTKKPAAKKAIAKKKINKPATPKKVVKTRKKLPVKNKTAASETDSERKQEMCGVFTSYVRDYEEKVSNCLKNFCDVYKRSLTRYRKKQKSYCG